MKKILILTILLLQLSFASNIAAGYPGSSDFTLLDKIKHNTPFTLAQTKGDLQNIRKLLKDPDIQMAVVQENIIKDLLKQAPSLKNDLIILSPLYKAVMVIIVPKNSPITSFKDLSNRRVAIDVEGSGAYYTFLDLQEKTLITPELFNMPIKDAFAYLRSNKADAIFYIGRLGDVAYLYGEYDFIPVIDFTFKSASFHIDQNNSIKTSYIDKYLVTTKKKEKKIDKSSLHTMLRNLTAYYNRNYLCSFNIHQAPIEVEDFIYFVCSEQISTQKHVKKIKKRAPKITIKSKLYYDSLEDITIYPEALHNKRFSDFGTSYLIEKSKLDNAIKLIKKRLAQEPNQKIIIISKGPQSKALRNMQFVYRYMKKAKVPRSALIKKVYPTPSCGARSCDFINTTIKFAEL